MALAAIFLGSASETLCRTGERLGDVERGLGERLGGVERGFMVASAFVAPEFGRTISCRTTVHGSGRVGELSQIRHSCVERLD